MSLPQGMRWKTVHIPLKSETGSLHPRKPWPFSLHWLSMPFSVRLIFIMEASRGLSGLYENCDLQEQEYCAGLLMWEAWWWELTPEIYSVPFSPRSDSHFAKLRHNSSLHQVGLIIPRWLPFLWLFSEESLNVALYKATQYRVIVNVKLNIP